MKFYEHNCKHKRPLEKLLDELTNKFYEARDYFSKNLVKNGNGYELILKRSSSFLKITFSNLELNIIKNQDPEKIIKTGILEDLALCFRVAFFYERITNKWYTSYKGDGDLQVIKRIIKKDYLGKA